MIGETLGSYRVLSKLGEGGMGAVYLAEHPLIGKRAAIKVLLPELCGSPEMVDRFFNEARATARLKHPGIVDVFDFGHHKSGSAFLVMELLEGESLATRIERGPLTASAIVSFARQICSALAAAHENGVVHRDLKPDNVFLVPDGDAPDGVRVMVLDFGIAKLVKQGGPDERKTKTGTMLGTPVYMSPEQCRGDDRIDLRADVYALGCILFEMACGRPPFESEVIAAHLRDVPPRPSQLVSSIPEPLEQAILRALQKRPEDRQQSMAELAASLDGARDSGPSPSRRSRIAPFVLAATAAAVVAVVVVAIRGSRTPASPRQAAVPPPRPAIAAPPPVQTTVRLHIDSTPPAAEVFRVADGLSLGTTPLDLDVQRVSGAQAAFLVKAAGFADARVTLPADRDGASTVRLTPVERSNKKVAKKPAFTAPASEDGVLSPFSR